MKAMHSFSPLSTRDVTAYLKQYSTANPSTTCVSKYHQLNSKELNNEWIGAFYLSTHGHK